MPKKNIEKNVLKEIKSHELKMRPKIYFVVGSALLGLGLSSSILLAIFFVSATFFRLRIHGPLGYLIFGEFGLRPFIGLFPWIPATVSVLLIFLGIQLLKKYDISYKKNFLVLAIGIITSIIIFSLILDRAGIGERAQEIKPLRPIFKEEFRGADFVMGEITSIEKRELTILTPDSEEVIILWNEETLLPFSADFEVGQRIRITGTWEEDVFVAKGIGTGGLRWNKPRLPVKGLRHTRPPIR